MDIPLEIIEQFANPFDLLYGLRLTSVSADKVVGEVDTDERHQQITGIVHGGVYASMIEASCSVGAAVWAGTTGNGSGAMGLSNHTDFLRSAKSGRVTVTATRVQSGGTLQLWQADVMDEAGTPLAHGVVRLMNVKEKR